MRIPEAHRRATRVGRRSQPHGRVNTVALPWVDSRQDLTDILAGGAPRDGNRFSVNGRVYILEGGGRLFPLSGDGLIPLGRGAYAALGSYTDFGVTEAVEVQLDREKVDEAERERARDVWRALQAWRQEQV
jgi:hypothetical protein